MLKSYTKAEKSWMLYDWANSAHSVIVVSLLPVFYSLVAGYAFDTDSAMTSWGYYTSAAMLISALIAPVLGALGDFEGYRKRLFFAFMLVGVLACAGLAITPLLGFVDNPEVAAKVGFAVLILYIASQIGYSSSSLYYDSFLPDVTTDERADRVSIMAYGLGYIGGSTIPLLAFLILNVLGVDMLYCLSFAFGVTSIWWFVFSIPLLKNVEQSSYIPKAKGAILSSFKRLGTTAKEIFKHKELFVFLLAYFFYIDGVGTVIRMSTIYGDTLGIDATMMMVTMLVVQLLGLPFCIIYMKLAEKFGARKMVGVAIIIYMFICVFGFFVRSLWQFWLLAILVSTSQGGVQALSRSMFTRMIPDKSRSGEFFGFYDIFGKFSAIMGPAIAAYTTAIVANKMALSGMPASQIAAASAPYGVISILLIFFIGGGLYFFVLPRYSKSDK